MKRASFVALTSAVIAAPLFVPPAAYGKERPAQVIYFGQERAPGVRATAVNFHRPSDRPNSVAPGVSGSVGEILAPATPPAPVAISAHNCIPRTDTRGVSLEYTFFESGVGDCVSFVSPPPARVPEQRRGRSPRTPAPETLAQRAYARMISIAPSPELDVAPARIGLTGLTSYFWVGNELRPITATAGVRGLTVTAEARPVRYLWDFGDGTTRTTQHGGRPWTRQSSGNVGHLYETKGRYDATVTVVWAARWRVNQAPWRDLGYFSTEGSTRYPVRQMLAVLVRRR